MYKWLIHDKRFVSCTLLYIGRACKTGKTTTVRAVKKAFLKAISAQLEASFFPANPLRAPAGVDNKHYIGWRWDVITKYTEM